MYRAQSSRVLSRNKTPTSSSSITGAAAVTASAPTAAAASASPSAAAAAAATSTTRRAPTSPTTTSVGGGISRTMSGSARGGGAGISSASAAASTVSRSRKGDEVSRFATSLQKFFSGSSQILAASIESKQDMFTAQVYEIAFINLMSVGEADAGGLFDYPPVEPDDNNDDDAHSNAGSDINSSPAKRRAAAAAKANREFQDFVRSAETQHALKQGADAIALLNGGGGVDGDVSAALDEIRRQAEFWRAVAQRTHRHNSMLTESKRMLEQAAQRSSGLAAQLRTAQEQLAERDQQLKEEVAKNSALTSERKGLLEQLAPLQESAIKMRSRIEHHERAEKAAKREREREAAHLQDVESRLKTSEQALSKTTAALDLQAQQLSLEKSQHRHLRKLYEDIVGGRRPAMTQTDIAGANVSAEEIAFELCASRSAVVAEFFHESLLGMMSRAAAAERKAETARKYADSALASLEEHQHVQENKERSWDEQVRQLKLEAQAEGRRADEERAKFKELVGDTQQLQRALRESQLELQHKDTAARLLRGEAKVTATQTDMSFDAISGAAKTMRKVPMAAQTDDGWFSDMAAQANMNTRSFIWTAVPSEEHTEKELAGFFHKKLRDLSAEHQLHETTILSGKRAKDSIQGAREVVKQILTSSNSSSGHNAPAIGPALHTPQTASQQRKEMLCAIRALSEAVTLSATHIKDLETEIERVLLDAARARPCRDQACHATTDAKGRLIVSGNKHESSSSRVLDPTEDFQRRGQLMQQDRGATSASAGAEDDSDDQNAVENFNFGLRRDSDLQRHHQQHQRQHHEKDHPSFATSFMTPVKDASSFDYSSINPSVVEQHQQERELQLQQQQQHSGRARSSSATALQQLLNRGESLEQGPQLPAGRQQNDIVSRIEAAQRQAQAALEVKSPPGMPKQQSPQAQQRRRSPSGISFTPPSLQQQHQQQIASRSVSSAAAAADRTPPTAASSPPHLATASSGVVSSHHKPFWNSTQRIVTLPQNQIVAGPSASSPAATPSAARHGRALHTRDDSLGPASLYERHYVDPHQHHHSATGGEEEEGEEYGGNGHIPHDHPPLGESSLLTFPYSQHAQHQREQFEAVQAKLAQEAEEKRQRELEQERVRQQQKQARYATQRKLSVAEEARRMAQQQVDLQHPDQFSASRFRM